MIRRTPHYDDDQGRHALVGPLDVMEMLTYADAVRLFDRVIGNDGVAAERELLRAASELACRAIGSTRDAVHVLAHAIADGTITPVRLRYDMPASGPARNNDVRPNEPRPRGSDDPIDPFGPRRRDDPRTSASEAMFVLLDEDGHPVVGERFIVRFSDGTSREGTTDADGSAVVTIPNGLSCSVTFPERDGAGWS